MVDLWADCARFQPDFPYIRPKLTGPWAPSTWVQLPYIAVEKSGSFVHTFYCGSKLLTVAVLWPVNKIANGGSSMASFRSLCPMCQQNCKPWHFYGHFSELTECSIHQNCKPWQFYGHFWSLQQSGHKTVNHCCSVATTFKIIYSPQNCKSWQFYGHFSESTKSGKKIANLGSSMATGISETRFGSARPRLKMSESQ